MEYKLYNMYKYTKFFLINKVLLHLLIYFIYIYVLEIYLETFFSLIVLTKKLIIARQTPFRQYYINEISDYIDR